MNRQALAEYRHRGRLLLGQARVTWSGLAVREKRVLSAGLLMLLAMLLWLLCIAPALKKIDYWQAETPRLRSQSQALEALLQDAVVNIRHADQAAFEQALRQALDTAGLKDHYQLQAIDQVASQGWQLSFEQAPAESVIGWLLGSPGQFSLQVTEAHLQRAGAAQNTGSAGTLSGTVRMDQAQDAKEAS